MKNGRKKRRWPTLSALFGRRSTGIVYLVCAGLILAPLAAYIAVYARDRTGSLNGLLGYAFLCAAALAVITVPLLIQKKLRLYIPPFIEIGLCVFCIVYCLSQTAYSIHTDAAHALLPLLGGTAISLSVFSVVYTYLEYRKKGAGKTSPFAAALLTFGLTEAVILVWHLIEYLVYLFFYRADPSSITDFLLTASGYSGVCLTVAAVCGLLVRSDNAHALKIKSFRDTDAARQTALDTGDKSFYSVIENTAGDDTDYRDLLGEAKSKYLLGKLVYLALYLTYLVYLIVSYRPDTALALALIVSQAVAFLLTAGTTVYEYRLYRKTRPSRRLRGLKVIKCAVRILSLGLTLCVLFQADFHADELSALTSVIMLVVNTVSLIFNLRKSFQARPSQTESASPDTFSEKH